MARSALINVMVRAAMKASRKLARDFGEVENLQVSLKGPADFVTAADRKSEEIIRQELEQARPGYSFLMEESGATEGSDSQHRWIVDPLDGTTNFLHGIPLFAISIALGGKQFVADRIIDDAGLQPALTLQRDRNGKERNAVQEIRRSVERIDDPAMLRIRPFRGARFLHQERIAGPRLFQLLADDFFRPTVGGGDKIRRTLLRHLQVLHLAEIARQLARRLQCGADRSPQTRKRRRGAVMTPRSLPHGI